MQSIFSIPIKPLDLLLQGTTTYLKPKSKDVGFFFKEPNLLCPVSFTSHYQLLITLNRPVASKKRTFFY